MENISGVILPIVSIPFIAGQWSLRVPSGGGAGPDRPVSIPFIAGQWSLREDNHDHD